MRAAMHYEVVATVPPARSSKPSVHCAVNDAPSGLGRVIQLFMYLRNHPDDNHYAHPLDFVPVADLNLKKVRQTPERLLVTVLPVKNNVLAFGSGY